MREFLLKQGLPDKLLDEVEAFRAYYKLDDQYIDRIPQPRYSLARLSAKTFLPVALGPDNKTLYPASIPAINFAQTWPP